jgi:GxxExxY protein
MKSIEEICDVVRQIGYEIHVYLGPGHLEKVYENAYVNRLRKRRMRVEQQVPIKVYDEDGTIIGDYIADLLVEGCLIVELKAAKDITDEHIAQILGYLRATRMKHGMIINFGAAKYQPRKFVI